MSERETPKIVAGMSEQQRYKILKDRVLTVTPCNPEKLTAQGFDEKFLGALTQTEAKPIMHALAREFGILHEYQNADISLEFNVSKRTLTESVNKQRKRFDSYAKMLTCFDDVIENAIGLEVHHDRYEKDTALKQMFTLISAFRDNQSIVPVKLEVKELNDVKNKLYLAVALCPIEKRKAAISAQLGSSPSYAPAAFIGSTPDTISIRRLARKINPIDKDFLKYFPDKMLSRRQRQAKADALIEEKNRIEQKQQRHRLKLQLQQGGGNATPASGPSSPMRDNAPSAVSLGKTKTQEKMHGSPSGKNPRAPGSEQKKSHDKKPWHWGMD